MKIRLGRYEFVIRTSKPKAPPRNTKSALQILNEGQFERDAENIRVILYHGDGTLGAEHIYRQWRDVFVESGVPFVGLIRNKVVFQQIAAEFPDDPVVLLVGNEETPNLISRMPRLKAVMHTGNPGNIVHLLQYGNLKHCFIGHGDSDKHSSASKTFRVYDEIWVAGQAHIDRLRPFGVNARFRIVGRPQVKAFVSSKEPSRLTAGYLPTWEGPNAERQLCSLEVASEVLGVLRRTFPVTFAKLHPCTGFRLRNLDDVKSRVVATGADLLDTNLSIDRVMRNANICVTDVSSVVSDWLVSKRPVFVYVPKDVDRASLPLSKYAYVYSDADELEKLIDRAVVRGDDYMREDRIAAAEYLVDSAATLGDEFLARLREVSEMDNSFNQLVQVP